METRLTRATEGIMQGSLSVMVGRAIREFECK